MSTLTQWDSASDWYDKNMGEQGDALNHSIILPTLNELLGDMSGKSILDSGCGSGYLSAHLAKQAKNVVGTDFADSFVMLCKKKYSSVANLSFEVHDVTKQMPFPDAHFDCVVSKMVLQYVQTIDIFAQESARVLKSRGKVVVIVDHPFNTQFYFAQAVAGKINPKYPELKDYFNHDPQNKLSLWGKVELTWYPKTVGEYIQPFIDSGLHLKKIIELPEEKKGIQIPRILGLQFEK